MIDWQWKKFDQLTTTELYEILHIRQQIFVLEQQCFYDDIDGRDPMAWHLTGWDTSGLGANHACAYLRVFGPSDVSDDVSFGRVLIRQDSRGGGMGSDIIRRALTLIAETFPAKSVEISAQHYLEKFYSSFGFITASEPYDEDGIRHIDMVKKWTQD